MLSLADWDATGWSKPWDPGGSEQDSGNIQSIFQVMSAIEVRLVLLCFLFVCSWWWWCFCCFVIVFCCYYLTEEVVMVIPHAFYFAFTSGIFCFISLFYVLGRGVIMKALWKDRGSLSAAQWVGLAVPRLKSLSNFQLLLKSNLKKR